MSERENPEPDLFRAADEAAEDGLAMSVDLEGFEGPLHVLLALARTHKIDLRELSIAELADQYLIFITAAQTLRLELAADYLVMASWLAYLKSRLLLPKPQAEDSADELPPEEMARRLAFRLRRLEAMRAAASDLMERDLDGRDIFARGAPEGVRSKTTPEWSADLYDLLKAYSVRRSRSARAHVRIVAPRVYSLEAARGRLERVLGGIADWTRLDALLPAAGSLGAPDTAPPRRSQVASAFAAGLELAKDGRAELRQDALFGPIYVRGRKQEAPA